MTTTDPSVDWDADLLARYPGRSEQDAPQHAFRDYAAEVRPSVKEFYRLNHEGQTLAYGRAQREKWCGLTHAQMGIWEALELLDTLVDDSDPDTEASQIVHALQTAEAIRADGHPDWFILTGLIHDLGKVLCLWGEPQWGVVGDTYPVGCAHSDQVVFAELFAGNPDEDDPVLSTTNGIYEPGCGFDNVLMSFGHDEYIYTVTRDYLPEQALAMLRYHSFYPWHREGAYAQLASDHDRRMLPWLHAFNQYDLYTKRDDRPDPAALRPYYEQLIARFFPATLQW